MPDPSSLSAAPPPAPRQALRALGLATATVLALVALGHDGRRVAQLMALALPALLWLAWPVRSDAVHRLRTAAVWLWAMAFALDGVARAYLLDAYQAAPDSTLVLGAAANTTGRESAEYLSMHWRSVAVWSAALVCAAWLVGRSARRGLRTAVRWPRGLAALLCALVAFSALGYASKPWRRLHPVAYWMHWNASVHGLRSGWADQERQRGDLLARARQAAPVITRAGPSTVVLVVTDSINRDNMGLYGYARPTTPRLEAQQRQLGGEMAVLRNAWSVDASTLPAMANLFGFGQPGRADGQHVVALARAAGYKVWWMSNHDDVAIEQQHARLADVVDMVNRTPGRAGASLDGELLDCVQEALDDPAERKLIVVHLMGAHPHYRLRFPSGDNPFDDHVDAVEAQLAGQGRSAWVRRYRQQYDAALLYQDFVVSETLQLTRAGVRPGEYRAWMYLSDHGQEVGHGSDRAGHSPATASGYRIPAVIWRNEAAQPVSAAMAQRPFRADWAGWTLADLLNIQWAGASPERNVLDEAGYRWVAPTLPVAVPSFSD
ncbi:sulfatase-like hydrolase/transferase [Acidovorax sp. NCPPB 3576]|uniref:sulfatase-like hydrolase/transferase n=1 Tax=Acidovorax sp. NCPPB 3576 TaxID=2940488 RepID=UPI003FA43DD8